MFKTPRLHGVLALAILGGCVIGSDDDGADGGGDTDDLAGPMDDPFPGANCADTDAECDTTSTTGSDPGTDLCQSSEDCESGFCAALPVTSAPADTDGDFTRTPLVCETACIEPLDDTRWCSDDASCCGAATCTERGYCIADEEDTDGGSTDGGSTGG